MRKRSRKSERPRSSGDGLFLLQRLAEALSVCDGPDAVAEALLAASGPHLAVRSVTVAVCDDAGTEFSRLAAAADRTETLTTPSGPIPVAGGSAAEEALRSGAPVFSSARQDEGARGSGLPDDDVCWVVLPLRAGGTNLGLLRLGWQESGQLDTDEPAVLIALAAECALALDRLLARDSERELRAVSDLLSEGTRLMVSALDPDEIVHRLVRLAVPRLAPWGAIYAADGSHLTRVALQVAGGPVTGLQDHSSVPQDAPLPIALAYRTGEIQVVGDLADDVARRAFPPGPGRSQVEPSSAPFTALVVPMKVAGRVIGVMALISNSWRGAPGSDVLRAAEGLAWRAGLSLRTASRYRREHETAATLTEAILPSYPAVPGGLSIAARYLPAGAAVAGDWYDTFQLADDCYLFGVGDAAGHGIEAASLMAELRNAARGLAIAGRSPSGILEGLDRLVEDREPSAFATALYGLAEDGGGSITWASAGHLPPTFFDGRSARFLEKADRPPLGSPGERRGEDRRLRLREGEGLVLSTDGVVERRRADFDERLEQLRNLLEMNGEEPAEMLAKLITDSLCRDREDDCCLLVLRREAYEDPS
jgi:GAF domain-containing protein